MNQIIKKIKTKKWQLILLGLIILVGALLRTYNFPYRYSLGEETVRDAVIGIEGAREIQFPLTGAFSSLGSFTFGPWYAYQLILFTMLFHSVYSPWIYLTLASIAYIFVIYKVGEELIDERFGILVAFLAAISPAQIISATHLTSHNMTNIFAVSSAYVFLRIAKKGGSYWLGFLLGFLIGVGINLHFQMSGLLIFPLILLFYKRKKYLYFLNAAAGVLVSFLPLFFFEANNHWFTTRNMFAYLLYGKNTMYVPNRWLFYLRDFWPSFWADSLGIPVALALIIIIFFLVVLVKDFKNKKLPIPLVLLITAFFVNFVMLRYYWGPRFFGYLNFMRPFVFIFTVYTIYSLAQIKRGIIVSVLILAAIVVLSYPKIILQVRKDPFTMTTYKEVNDAEKLYPNKKFAVYSCSPQYYSSYNAQVYSILFLFEQKHEFDSKGIKIGVGNECGYPQDENVSKETLSDLTSIYPKVSSEGLTDLSNASDKLLKNSGWTQVTFASMYNAYARWWFQQQP